MNLEYLEQLLDRAERLISKHADIETADEIKMKASEAYKILFPSEPELAAEMKDLCFEIKLKISLTNENSYDYSVFRESKSRLVSTLIAKIDVLKFLSNSNDPIINKDVEFAGLKEDLEHLKQQLILANKNANDLDIIFQEVNRQKIRAIEESTDLRTRLTNSEKQLRILSDNVNSLEEGIVKAKKIRLFKELGLAVTILGGAFLLGIYIGNAKFDHDKINMDEKNRFQKMKIDSLEKAVRTNWRPGSYK